MDCCISQVTVEIDPADLQFIDLLCGQRVYGGHPFRCTRDDVIRQAVAFYVAAIKLSGMNEDHTAFQCARCGQDFPVGKLEPFRSPKWDGSLHLQCIHCSN